MFYSMSMLFFCVILGFVFNIDGLVVFNSLLKPIYVFWNMFYWLFIIDGLTFDAYLLCFLLILKAISLLISKITFLQRMNSNLFILFRYLFRLLLNKLIIINILKFFICYIYLYTCP